MHPISYPLGCLYRSPPLKALGLRRGRRKDCKSHRWWAHHSKGTASSRHSRANTHMNSQSMWCCVQDLNSFRYWEGDTKCCLYSRSYLQQISVWKWRIGILQWSVTGSINHTRADPMPGNTDHTPGFFRWAFNFVLFG